jgi:hypothetical protein
MVRRVRKGKRAVKRQQTYRRRTFKTLQLIFLCQTSSACFQQLELNSGEFKLRVAECCEALRRQFLSKISVVGVRGKRGDQCKGMTTNLQYKVGQIHVSLSRK